MKDGSRKISTQGEKRRIAPTSEIGIQKPITAGEKSLQSALDSIEITIDKKNRSKTSGDQESNRTNLAVTDKNSSRLGNKSIENTPRNRKNKALSSNTNKDSQNKEEEKQKPYQPTYNEHSKRMVKLCYGDLSTHVLQYKQKLQSFEFSEDFSLLVEEILNNKALGNMIKLTDLRTILTRDKIFNLLIYDIQTTGMPSVNDGKIVYPGIIQISIYHPLTGRQYTKYLTSTIPITYNSGLFTGIYNSSQLSFRVLEPKINGTVEYLNHSLLERSDVKESAEKYFKAHSDSHVVSGNHVSETAFYSSPKEDNYELDAWTTSLEKFTSENDELVYLDDLNRNKFDDQDGIEFKARNELGDISNRLFCMKHFKEFDSNTLNYKTRVKIIEPMERAPYLWETIIEIVQFISETEYENTTTVLLSHNGNLWGEPILKNEFVKYSVYSNEADLIYLDSRDLFFGMLKGELISKSMFELNFGDDVPETYNAAGNVISLWTNIEYIFKELYGSKEHNFIMSLIAEEIFKTHKSP